MATMLRRLLRIARSYRNAGTGQTRTENQKNDSRMKQGAESFDYGKPHSEKRRSQSAPDYPGQVVEDLANFSLTPPSSFAEVKKARKRESKKYHPDRFASDPARQATAQKIMQIYNASYERLKVFFQNHPN
jgi:DnaJ-domain-containing protein 1